MVDDKSVALAVFSHLVDGRVRVYSIPINAERYPNRFIDAS